MPNEPLRAKASRLDPDKLRGANKLERAFAARLEKLRLDGELLEWRFNEIKFRLGDRCWYMPDFSVINKEGQLVFYETKGFMRDAAQVKTRVFANKYPHIRLVVVRAENRKFTFEEIEPYEESVPNTD